VVHGPSGEPLTNRAVHIDKGKIAGIHEGQLADKAGVHSTGKDHDFLSVKNGNDVTLVPVARGTQIVKADGLHLYPGMIDAATVIGLTELGSARETQDFAEGGDFQPDLRASTGVNPDSELIPVTRANGVLAVVTRPMGGIVAGQSALINLAGWVPKE